MISSCINNCNWSIRDRNCSSRHCKTSFYHCDRLGDHSPNGKQETNGRWRSHHWPEFSSRTTRDMWGWPFRVIATWYWQLHPSVYFQRSNRFDILEGVGCVVARQRATILHFSLSLAWLFPIALISAFYCGMSSCIWIIGSAQYSECSYDPAFTLRAFIRRRRVFESLIVSNENLTYNRYFRLMAICVIEIVSMVPLCVLIAFNNAAHGSFGRYPGLTEPHSNFTHVGQYPAVLWTHNPMIRHNIETYQWIMIGCSLLYFALFGLTEEARKHYHTAFNIIWLRPSKPPIIYEPRIQRYFLIFRRIRHLCSPCVHPTEQIYPPSPLRTPAIHRRTKSRAGC